MICENYYYNNIIMYFTERNGARSGHGKPEFELKQLHESTVSDRDHFVIFITNLCPNYYYNKIIMYFTEETTL